MNNDLWVWGYTLDKCPGRVPYAERLSRCSLETAADYLGADNVVYMDGTHNIDLLNPEQMKRLSKFKRVICGLTHIEEADGWHLYYKEAARRVSELSLQFPNITGALIDDFRDPPGPSGKMTPAGLKEVYEALKSVNPKLKLYLVRYHVRQDYEELLAYRDYFDGINVWCWNSTEHFWRMLYKFDLRKLREMMPEKEVLQGQFIHDFDAGDWVPMAMDQLELQCEKISLAMREKRIDGWVVLQNGFFDAYDHRKQVCYLKEFLQWFFGTWSRELELKGK